MEFFKEKNIEKKLEEKYPKAKRRCLGIAQLSRPDPPSLHCTLVLCSLKNAQGIYRDTEAIRQPLGRGIANMN